MTILSMTLWMLMSAAPPGDSAAATPAAAAQADAAESDDVGPPPVSVGDRLLVAALVGMAAGAGFAATAPAVGAFIVGVQGVLDAGAGALIVIFLAPVLMLLPPVAAGLAAGAAAWGRVGTWVAVGAGFAAFGAGLLVAAPVAGFALFRLLSPPADWEVYEWLLAAAAATVIPALAAGVAASLVVPWWVEPGEG